MGVKENILDTIAIIADSKNSQLKLDKTIKAEIVSVENVNIGEYKVKYEGNIFPAYSENIENIYEVNDYVYINVPQNDLSNKKFITGRVSNKDIDINTKNKQKTEIREIVTLDKIYKNQTQNFSKACGITAGVDKENEEYEEEIFNYSKEDEEQVKIENMIFQSLNETYDKIKISADFMTSFYSAHTVGDYGIKLTFVTKTNDKVNYYLHLPDFFGDPYNFSIWSNQSAIIETKKNYLDHLESVTFFQADFEQDINIFSYEIVDGEVVPKGEPVKENNIFVKNINIAFVEVVDTSNVLYDLSIIAREGISFTNKDSELNFSARLISKGRDLTNADNCKCYWYKEVLPMFKGKEGYDDLAGERWKYLGKGINISINKDNIFAEQKFKLVCIYKDENKLEKEITLFDIEEEVYKDVKLSQKTLNEVIWLELENVPFQQTENGENIPREESYKVRWFVQYPDGRYEEVQRNEGSDPFAFNIMDYLQYTKVTFYCQLTLISDTNEENILNKELTIYNTASQEDLKVIFTGQDTYQYDVNGDIAYEDTEIERLLSAELIWREGYGTIYTVQWLDEDGTPFGTSENNKRTPNNSMLQNVWVDKDFKLHYNIKQKYYNNSNKNTVYLSVITIDNKVYNFSKQLQFFKDGDQGTNGSTYFCIIRPIDEQENKIEHFTGLKYNNGWQGKLTLKAFVYHNGELINDLADNSFTWTKPNENISINTDTGKIVNIQGIGSVDNEDGDTKIADGQYYIKLKVRLPNGESIYYNYPIPVIVGEFEEKEIKTNIPFLIKYTKSGVKGYYNNDDIWMKCGNTDLDNLQSIGLDSVQIQNNKLKIPVSFDFSENKIAAIKAKKTGSSDYIIYPIILYLDTTDNEAIEGWDGTKLPINIANNYSAFAPQIGAGVVKDNKFTGVIMGKDYTKAEMGLYGYQNGECSFGLQQDGKAFFGINENNRITIDGSTATIQGGNGTSDNNLVINLTGSGEKKALQIGTKFNVDYNGKIKSTYGSIGGWQIGENKLYGASDEIADEKDNVEKGAYTILNKNGQIITEKINIRYNKENIGNIGQIDGYDGFNLTNNMGIKSNQTSIVLETPYTIRLSGETRIYFDTPTADFTGTENFLGLYATLAD